MPRPNQALRLTPAACRLTQIHGSLSGQAEPTPERMALFERRRLPGEGHSGRARGWRYNRCMFVYVFKQDIHPEQRFDCKQADALVRRLIARAEENL